MNEVRRFMSFVKPYRWLIVLTIIIGIVKFLFPILNPMIMKYTIDDIIFANGLSKDEKINSLIQLMLIVSFAYIIIRPFVEYYRQYLGHLVSNKILRNLRVQLFDHIQKLSLKYYTNTKTGEVISRVISDVEQIKNFVITGLMNIWIDIFTAILIIVIMLKLHVTLTIVSLIIFPFYMISVKYFYKRLKQSMKDKSQSLANLQSFLHERIQGISVIMSFAREKTEMDKFNEKNKELYSKSVKNSKYIAQTFAATNTIAEIAPIIVLLMAGLYVIETGLTVGTLVAFTGLLANLYAPLKRIADSANVLTQSIASIERVYEFMDEEYDIKNKLDAKDVRIQKGQIRFENVSFGYVDDKKTIKNITLEIESGENAALVGESGGGKSSLINLLPRYYDVTEGEIKIDGTNIKDMTLYSLRNQIGVVSQENILFNESIKENIKLGKPFATDEEVIEAAIKAQAHEFIESFSEGYETKIGERGVKLSGGQKQRIALARAFLKNPPILILDEATSALDLESEYYIQEALEELTKNRTTLTIAHRLSTIVDADKIIYIENGEVQEVGTHDELMKKKGKYFDLYNMQK